MFTANRKRLKTVIHILLIECLLCLSSAAPSVIQKPLVLCKNKKLGRGKFLKTLKRRAFKMITLQLRWFLFAYGLSFLLTLSFVPKGFSPGSPVLPSCQKQTFPNFHLIKNTGTHLNINSFTQTIKLNLLLKWLLGSNLSQHLNEFLKTPSKCFVGKQNYNIKYSTKDNRLHRTNQLED